MNKPFALENFNALSIQKCEGAGCGNISILSDFDLGVYMLSDQLLFDNETNAHLGSKVQNLAKFGLRSKVNY